MRDTLAQYIESVAYADYKQKPIGKVLQPRKVTEVVELRLSDRELEKDAPSTGYSELDFCIRGFIPGRLYTLTGDTNVGKTAVACNFTHNVSSQGKRVLYFALEPDRAIVEYLVSISLDKPFTQVTKADLRAFTCPNIDIYGADQITTISGLVQAVETLERYDLVIVDHIGYFVKPNVSSYYVEQDSVLKQLALLSQRKSTAIMLIAHLNKSANTTPDQWVPSMNQISGTAAFKQDSDDVLILARRPEEMVGVKGALTYTDEGMIYIAKTKAGRNGVVRIRFMPDSAKVKLENNKFTTNEGDF